MTKKGFITGVNGQDGSYLAEFLLEKDYEVYGMIRRSSTDTTERIDHILDHERFHLVEGDVTDATGVNRLFCRVMPDEVYNLAAQSHVGTSFDQPVATFEINAIGVINLLEAIRQFKPECKFYQASTSELFGDTQQEPQHENFRMNPCSPYAIAKLAAHKMVSTYRKAYDMYACAGILFNHESPRRGLNFVTRKITNYIAGVIAKQDELQRDPIKGKDIPALQLGNLDSKRDWSHAKDMVRGMWMMMQQEKPEDFVLSSGTTRTIRDLLVIAFEHAGLDYMKYVEINPDFYRPAEVTLLRGTSAYAKQKMGWEPEITFNDMIVEMIESDTERVSSGSQSPA